MGTVLVVEDDRSYQKLAQRDLRNNYTVHIAATEDEGYKLALQHRPQVIILDRTLKKGTGVDLAQKLRENDKTADAYILGWGGFDATERANLNQYVPKMDIYGLEIYNLCDLVAEGFK